LKKKHQHKNIMCLSVCQCTCFFQQCLYCEQTV